jgi:hypothetical protein
MQNRTLIYGLVAIAILASTGAAFAQSETDRLREALRQAIAQTRTLEDERTALQGKLASAECDKANLKAQVEGAQAETKKAQKQYRDAVEEFNSRLAERDATLDKWKSAYEEAADVARAKDAERAKFETEATACEASVKSCRSKNTQLVKIDRELVRRKRRHPFRRQAGRARTADRGWARTSSKPAAGLYRQDPRPKGYLGVMVDDLVTRGVTEPYRMFTSRAEYRLALRADNADQRLTDKGIALGCIGPERGRRHQAKMAALKDARAMAEALNVTPNEAARHGLELRRDGQRRSAFDLLSYPDIGIAEIARIWPRFGDLDPKIAEQLEIDAKYAVYLDRQAADVESYRRDEALTLGDDMDYETLPGLSNEVRYKLQTHRPRTIGHASRLDGITPAALTLLAAHVHRERRKRDRGAA